MSDLIPNTPINGKPQKPLTLKEQRFVEEYLIDGNGTRSHKDAGYAGKNDAVHRVEAARMLAKPNIASAVEKGRQAMMKRAEIDQDWVISRLKRLADSDIGEVLTFSGHGVTLKDSEELAPEQRRLIDSVGETKDGVRLKMKDSVQALRMLGEHVGLFQNVQKPVIAIQVNVVGAK